MFIESDLASVSLATFGWRTFRAIKEDGRCRGNLAKLLQSKVLPLQVNHFLKEIDLVFTEDSTACLSVQVIAPTNLPVKDGDSLEESESFLTKLTLTEG